MSRMEVNGCRNLCSRTTSRSTRDWQRSGLNIFVDEDPSSKDRWVTRGSENEGITSDVFGMYGWPRISRRSRFWHWESALRNSAIFPMLSVESSSRFSQESGMTRGRDNRQNHRMVRRLWVLKRRSASNSRFINPAHPKFGQHTLTDCKGMEGNLSMFPRGSNSCNRNNSKDWQRLSEFRKSVRIATLAWAS